MRRNEKGPVFIVGMNGSGTTMLADSLGHHPDIYMFPEETRVLIKFISELDKYGNLDQLESRKRLASDLGKCWAYWEINDREPVTLDDKMISKPGFPGVLDGLYGYFACKEGKSRWGEKTPMYLQHLELLAQHIPLSKFVHIFRDGRDVAQSMHRRWRRNTMRTICRWKRVTRLGMEQGRKLGSERYIEISYESLTTEPETNMHSICEFLELPFHPDVLKSSRPYMESSADGNIEKRIVKNVEKWRNYFTEEEICAIEKIAGTFLSQLGYPLASTQAGDTDPSVWKLRYWQYQDRTRDTYSFLKERGISAFSRLLRRGYLTWIQDRTNRY